MSWTLYLETSNVLDTLNLKRPVSWTLQPWNAQCLGHFNLETSNVLDTLTLEFDAWRWDHYIGSFQVFLAVWEGTASRPRAGRSGAQIPAEAKYFSPKIQTSYGTHPASYSKSTGDSSPDDKAAGLEAEDYLHLVPRLRILWWLVSLKITKFCNESKLFRNIFADPCETRVPNVSFAVSLKPYTLSVHTYHDAHKEGIQ
jgi:hypothetical protein